MMLDSRPVVIFIAVLATSLGLGCATTMHGTKQLVSIQTDPPGATARILPDEITVTTPAEVELPRKTPHTVLISLDSHGSRIVFIDRLTSGAVNGNILAGGLIGMQVDADNGAAFKLEPDELFVRLKPLAQSTVTEEDPETTFSAPAPGE